MNYSVFCEVFSLGVCLKPRSSLSKVACLLEEASTQSVGGEKKSKQT